MLPTSPHSAAPDMGKTEIKPLAMLPHGESFSWGLPSRTDFWRMVRRIQITMVLITGTREASKVIIALRQC
jgi:hypothetical protein